MHGHGKSDGCVVPAKPSNNAASAAAEVVEGRRPAKGNTDRPTRTGHSAGQRVPSGLDRVREVARTDKEARFTALLHHVDVDRLLAAYWAINPKAAPGVDQVTWDAYGQNLRVNLEDLLRRRAQRCLPGEPLSPGVHTEAGRAAASARDRGVGGQDSPTRGGGGVERGIRGGLSRFFVRVSGPGVVRMMRWTRSRLGYPNGR